MRLLVVSDTHGKANLNAIAALAANVDLVVHLGDGFRDGQILQSVLRIPLVQVSGNADAPLDLVPEKTLYLAGRQVFLTHGHPYRVKAGLDQLRNRAAELGADLVLFGHLHSRLLDDAGSITLFNPASAWKNRDGSPPCAGLVDLSAEVPLCTWVDLLADEYP
ncbi:MAG: YfcE family phosphodiesterase [Cyanobacteria bacterium REEB65]|nr:YfcE family phosphodiesterase [Cyanobacteria bacterium REEB65]